jgi:hypothetical protein
MTSTVYSVPLCLAVRVIFTQCVIEPRHKLDRDKLGRHHAPAHYALMLLQPLSPSPGHLFDRHAQPGRGVVQRTRPRKLEKKLIWPDAERDFSNFEMLALLTFAWLICMFFWHA